MSSEAAASRSGGAGGRRAHKSSPAGRLDERAWSDIRRAYKLGAKGDVHAVEVHGVRIIFKKGSCEPPWSARTGEHQPTPARASTGTLADASRRREVRPPNSAQRRSARRLKEFLEAKKGSGPSKATGPPPPAGPQADEATRAETGEREADEPMDEAEESQRGRKRAAGDSPACEPSQPTDGPQGPRQVESTGRDRFSRGGLKPLHMPPAERRRENAAAALDKQRSSRGRG